MRRIDQENDGDLSRQRERLAKLFSHPFCIQNGHAKQIIDFGVINRNVHSAHKEKIVDCLFVARMVPMFGYRGKIMFSQKKERELGAAGAFPRAPGRGVEAEGIPR